MNHTLTKIRVEEYINQCIEHTVTHGEGLHHVKHCGDGLKQTILSSLKEEISGYREAMIWCPTHGKQPDYNDQHAYSPSLGRLSSGFLLLGEVVARYLAKPEPSGDQEVDDTHQQEREDELTNDQEERVSLHGPTAAPLRLAALRHSLAVKPLQQEDVTVDRRRRRDRGGHHPDQHQDRERRRMRHAGPKRIHDRQISVEKRSK